MIKALLMDVGKTIVTNRIIDFKKGLRAVYELDDNPKKIDFNEYLRVNNALRKVSFDIARENNSEVRIATFLETLNEITGIKSVYTGNELEWFFQCHLIEEELVQGVYDFLECARSIGLIIIAVSNSCMTSYPIKREFTEMGIDKFFSEVISSADILVRKPRKEIFDYAYGKLLKIDKTIKKEEVLFIGNDFICDTLGSSNAGFIPVWFNEKGESVSDNSFTFINVKSYDELKEVLKIMI